MWRDDSERPEVNRVLLKVCKSLNLRLQVKIYQQISTSRSKLSSILHRNTGYVERCSGANVYKFFSAQCQMCNDNWQCVTSSENCLPWTTFICNPILRNVFYCFFSAQNTTPSISSRELWISLSELNIPWIQCTSMHWLYCKIQRFG